MTAESLQRKSSAGINCRKLRNWNNLVAADPPAVYARSTLAAQIFTMMAPSDTQPGDLLPSSEAVGERIKKARKEHPDGPMKRAQLALHLGVHEDTLTKYESGVTEVGAVTLWWISKWTKRPFSYFADQAPETAQARLARVAAATQEEIARLTVRLEALMGELRDARSDAAAATSEAEIDDATRRGIQGAK